MAESLDTEAKLNDFAIRSFRDTADTDYIAARACWRLGLYYQYRWQSLQCIEKYMKCILLINRVEATKIQHNIDEGMRALQNGLPFGISLSERSKAHIKHIHESGAFRYLEISYSVLGNEYLDLDRTVWELRRYCRTFWYDPRSNDPEDQLGFSNELVAAEGDAAYPHRNTILDGLIETIIKTKSHPARAALVWNNFYFASKKRNTIRSRGATTAVNAPLYMHPEIIEDVVNYVYLPKEVIRQARSLARPTS